MNFLDFLIKLHLEESKQKERIENSIGNKVICFLLENPKGFSNVKKDDYAKNIGFIHFFSGEFDEFQKEILRVIFHPFTQFKINEAFENPALYAKKRMKDYYEINGKIFKDWYFLYNHLI